MPLQSAARVATALSHNRVTGTFSVSDGENAGAPAASESFQNPIAELGNAEVNDVGSQGKKGAFPCGQSTVEEKA